MKKSLLLLASMLVSAASFAQWTAPTPTNYQEVATDGTEQFLYNKEAGGFFCGGNDWNTRASVGTSADPIRFTVYDGENYNFGCYPSVKGNWLYVSCNNYDAMWVDAPNADTNKDYPGTDSWQLSKNANGSYAISNTLYEGTLGVAEIYRGLKGNTRVYINDPLDQYDLNDEVVPSITGKFYNEWYFIDQAEYEALKPQVEVYLAALALDGAISRVLAQDASYDTSVLKAVYNNTSSTIEELNAAVAVADAAIAFSQALDAAQKSYSLDFSAPIAVYKNAASTADELTAAKNQIQEIINSYLATQATFDTPIDFTSTIGDGSDVGPWQRVFTGEGEVGTWHTNTWSTEANNGGDGTDMITPFCEDWVANGSLLSDQKIFQVLAGAAPGLYKFSANVRLYNEKGDQEALTGCTMYFGDERVTLDEQVSMYKSGSKCVLWKDGGFQIIAILKEAADVEFGFDIKDPTFNWMAFKETSLKYYGNEDVEANALLLTKGDKVYEPFEGTNASVAVIEAYNEAVEKFNSAQTAEEIKEAVTAISTAKTALEASQKAYNTYIAKIDEIRDYFANNELFGDKSDIVADYIMEGTEEEPDEVNPCGSADYIIVNHELTDEQIKEETERITDLFKEAIAESLYEGKDCTNLLTNPNFSAGNSTGWTVNVNPTNFAWTGGLLNVPVCESWHSLFDISQEVSAPDGIYAISLNGFCRLDDGVDSEVPAEVYINNFASKLQNLNGAPIAEADAIDGFNAYLSNGSAGAWTTNPIFQDKDGNPCKRQSPADNTDSLVDGGYVPNGMEGASVAFSAGRYQAVAYGLCEGGKLTVGVRNRVSTHVWALWGNFKLTFMGKNFEALQSILPSYVEQLAHFEEENADNLTVPVMTNIDNAIAKGNEASDADEMFKALEAVNAALVAAQANKEAVVAFSNESEALSNILETYPNADQTPYNEISEEISDWSSLQTEEVLALVEKMKAAEKAIIFSAASPEEPADITDLYIVNARMDDGSITGWTDTFSTGNHGYQNNQVYGDVINQFMEAWVATPNTLADGTISQEITLPAGNYVLSADVIAKDQANGEEVTGMYFFVGDERVAVNADSETPGRYEIPFALGEETTITIGLAVEGTNGNWLAADNFTLMCLGTDITAINEIVSNLNAKANGIYTVSGARIAKVQKGLNIVKMSNGSVKKIFVK